MTSLNDVLLAMSNIPVDDPIAEILGRGLQAGHEIVEYTGTLPITITADGNALLDYRIYGNTVQTGTPTPENPVDVVGCGERTENLFDIEQYNIENVSKSSDGSYFADTYQKWGWCIPTEIGKTYTILASAMNEIKNGSNLEIALCKGYRTSYTSQDNTYGLSLKNVAAYQVHTRTFNFTATEEWLTIVGYKTHIYSIMISEGSTPLPYEPYGYKLPMTVSDGNTVQNVPVYIGENKLTEAEYVSYGEQKIYRDVDGTLTPTDPPVPFPEIPTIDGTTIIDYDGTPKPSQMYIKYRR